MLHEYTSEFVAQALYRIEESFKKVEKCFEELNEHEIWKRPNPHSNSVGNIMLHLCGNIRQYAISSLGGSRDVRERDQEFLAKGGFSKQELFTKLQLTVDEAKNVIRNISQPELLRRRSVQGFTQSGIGIIVHVTEHLSYHTGQIVFWTKLLRDKDLGFYSGVDLNLKNDAK